MTEVKMSNSGKREPMNWGEIAGFALLGLVVVLLVQSSRTGASLNLVPAGTPFPRLMVEGWLNVDESPYDGQMSRKHLKGKVLLVDCWATWCPPCRAAMPELAELYTKYKPLGVEFVGLTSESVQDLSRIHAFLEQMDDVTWPIGYGATPMQDMLGIQVLPTVIVFGADGTAVWSGSQLYGVEDALDQALATVAPE